jgi:hypothetical protein
MSNNSMSLSDFIINNNNNDSDISDDLTSSISSSASMEIFNIINEAISLDTSQEEEVVEAEIEEEVEIGEEFNNSCDIKLFGVVYEILDEIDEINDDIEENRILSLHITNNIKIKELKRYILHKLNKGTNTSINSLELLQYGRLFENEKYILDYNCITNDYIIILYTEEIDKLLHTMRILFI